MKIIKRLSVCAAIALIVLAGLGPDAFARHARGFAAVNFTASRQPLGLNLIELDYGNGYQPFLNAFKNAAFGPESWLSVLNAEQNYEPYMGWVTVDCAVITTCASFTSTNEEAYLQTDSSQYVTSLTASPTPGGGQVYNAVEATMLNSLTKYPGATQYYQPGYYTLSFEGSCTIILTGDASGISMPTGGLTSGMISGNTITSTMGASTSGTVQVDIPTATGAGVHLFITAVASSSNYCSNISFVYTTWTTPFVYDGHTYPGFNNGQVFNPWFLDWLLQSPLNTIRFMRAFNMNAEPFNGLGSGHLCLEGPVTATTTTATLGTCISTSAGYWAANASSATLSSAWAGTSGTYTVTWADGEQRNVAFTNGSAAISFTALTYGSSQYSIAAVNYAGPVWKAPSGTWLLSFVSYEGNSTQNGGNVLMTATTDSATLTFPGGGAPTAETPFFYITLVNNWTQRPKYTDAFWNTMRGIPYDVAGILCNTVNGGNGSNCWINVPHLANTIPGFASGIAQLFYNGTGDTSGLFSHGLNTANKWIPEIGNEDWNTSTQNGQFALAQGITIFGSDYRNLASWRGSQIAILAQTIAGVYGSSYGARVAPTFAGQYGYGSGGDAAEVIAAYDWVQLGNTAPWDITQYGGAESPTNPWLVSSMALAPYLGVAPDMCAADFTELQAQSDGGLTMFFNSQYANPVYDARTSSNYSFSQSSSCSTALPATGWQGANVAQIGANQTGMNAITGATRTIPITYYEMGNDFYGGSSYAAQQTFYLSAMADSRAVTMYEGYFAAIKAANSNGTACEFAFASANSNNGNFGLIQGVNQSNTPSVLSTTPYPWQGFVGSTL